MHERCHASTTQEVSLAVVWAIVLDKVQVDPRYLTITPETHLDAPLPTWSGTSDVVLFLPVYPHHYRTTNFLGKQARNCFKDRPRDLAAESTTAILANEN